LIQNPADELLKCFLSLICTLQTNCCKLSFFLKNASTRVGIDWAKKKINESINEFFYRL